VSCGSYLAIDCKLSRDGAAPYESPGRVRFAGFRGWLALAARQDARQIAQRPVE